MSLKSAIRTLLLITLVLFQSCKNTNKNDASLFKTNKFELPIDKVFRTQKISLESNVKSMISFPYDLIRCNNRIIISSRATEIKVFDMNGRYLYKIGRIGEGPGEYKSINCLFSITDNKIGIYDQSNSRISIFDINGNYLMSKIVNIEDVYSLRRIINYRNNYYIHKPYTKKYPCNLMMLDSNFKIINNLLEASDNYAGYLYRGLFNGGIFLDTTSNSLYEINTYSDNIVRKLDLKTGHVTNINLGQPYFYKIVPPLKNLHDVSNTMKNYHLGTDIFNMFVLKNRYLFIQYLDFENNISKVKMVLYDLNTYNSYLLKGIIAPTYSDGNYLYELRYSEKNNNKDNQVKNAIIILYNFNEGNL